jgi:hypothetical protein
MPWVRLDDHFPDHPKVVAAGPLAAWLYVAALCYCNRLLTNGFIPTEQVARLVPRAEKKEFSEENSGLLASKLCALNLWSPTDRKGVPGFQIHDFLKYQLSKRQIIKERTTNAARQGRFRVVSRNGGRNAVTGGVTNSVTNGPVTPVPTPTPTPTPNEERKNAGGGGAVHARSKRPIFKGQRLVVFEWQLDDCLQVLGKYVEDFDLHAWFFALDAELVDANFVLPPRDGGRFLQNELLKEVKKRRLPIAGQSSDDGDPHAWQCKKCGEIHEGTAAQRGRCLKRTDEIA